MIHQTADCSGPDIDPASEPYYQERTEDGQKPINGWWCPDCGACWILEQRAGKWEWVRAGVHDLRKAGRA
jgi:hypothetical protein